MARNSLLVELLDEELQELTAKILGTSSAAHVALDDAKLRRQRGEEVGLGKHGATIVVIPTSALIKH